MWPGRGPPLYRAAPTLHQGNVFVTRGNDLRLEKSQVKHDLRKFGFTNTVVNMWKSFPNWVVSANTTNTFKTRLDKFWHNQDIIYNFRAQLQGTGSHSQFLYEESQQGIIPLSDYMRQA